MNKKFFILIPVCIFLFTLFFVKPTKTYLNTPDKIVIYNKSTIETIEKDSNQFNNIYKLITKQLKTDLDYYKTGLSQFDIDNIKANDIVLEFVYNTKQKTKFLTDTREYYRLIMPLTGEYNDMFFFYDNTQHYMAPLGKLNSADSIIKLLNY